ncbi:unnamed protein product [Microthlaspi erraticum]|uniref:Uncharacterized protein n=1 Tax=Microthlaspi erraticum TaxID=1685480 RepID=A0A6D2JAR0_9BRAS|nr:unnamed protein product [Microthlaspi erraticum]
MHSLNASINPSCGLCQHPMETPSHLLFQKKLIQLLQELDKSVHDGYWVLDVIAGLLILHIAFRTVTVIVFHMSERPTVMVPSSFLYQPGFCHLALSIVPALFQVHL